MPPSAINWNDADDNNAFHAKTIVMDLDGAIRPRGRHHQERRTNTTTSSRWGWRSAMTGSQFPASSTIREE